MISKNKRVLLAIGLMLPIVAGCSTTKTVEKVPDVCLQALDAADALNKNLADGLSISAKTMNEVPAMLDAIMYNDIQALSDINDRVDGYTAEMTDVSSQTEGLAGDYANKRDACRATK